MAKLVNFKEDINLSGYILLLPSVSVGNVPQLTVDLLIHNLPCRKVGSVWHPAVEPLVGADPYDETSKNLSTACEMYANTDLKIAMMQLRSAVEFKLASSFFAHVKAFILEHKFREVVILTSSFDYELHNITKEKFYYISNYEVEEKKFRGVSSVNRVKKFEASESGRFLVHGSGFAVKLYELFGEDIKSTVLIKYVSEGDNTVDAFRFIEVLCSFIDILDKDMFNPIKLPCSWKYVYGGSPPIGLY